ncbi:MAG: methionyl-tRNA formyltransferase [Firmicutes bacterium]|nr:methionyl-tRNA formyltransferase [Bacillota bacterium]
MKVIFLGTPWFSTICLEAVIKSKHKVVGVVTAQDAILRGKPIPTAVKNIASQFGIPVFQTEKLSKDENVLQALKGLNADIIITCAFGQMLRQNVLELCKYGVINVHPSLLPKYRGSSPVQWAIINGETVSGVTIMHTDIGMDTGDIICQETLEILPTETTYDYKLRVFPLAAKMLVETLTNIEKGTSTRTPQNHNQHTYFPMLTKEHGKIDFNKTSSEIINLIRGLNPWPACFVVLDGVRIKVLSASIRIEQSKFGIFMKTADGEIRLDKICPEGRSVMDSGAYLNGIKK